MRRSVFGAAAIAVLVAVCGTARHAAAQTVGTMTGTLIGPPGNTETPVIIPVPEVPSVAPPIEGSPQTRQPFIYRPGPTAPSGTSSSPLNQGPVTGYGPGGLALPPGAPANPPFHYVR